MLYFGCLVTIINTLDPLGKFEGKADEGFLVGYSVNSNAFRVFNSRTIIIQEKLHINFLENQPNDAGSEPKWLFNIDTPTQSMNYQPVIEGNQPTHSGGIKETLDADEFSVNSTNRVNAASTPVSAVRPNPTNSTNSFNAASPSDNAISPNFEIGGKSLFVDPSQCLDDPDMPALEDIVYSDDEEDVGVEADLSNLETHISVSPIPTIRVHKDHLVTQIISDLTLVPQTRSMTRVVKEQNLPKGKKAIGSKWVFGNKKDERGILIRNKVQLVAQGHTQEEGIDYEEVFAPVARIETIRLFLAYASFMGFMVYVDDIIFGSTNKELCKAFEKLKKDKFQISSVRELTFFLRLQVKPKNDGIFINQDKYVDEILRKFGFTDVKSASTPIETEKPLLKDPDGKDVDVHIYISMIGSLMYLTSSGPDIMYLKGKPDLGFWYPKDSPFNLVAYSDSDYVRASLDRKSITGGCQFLDFLNAQVIHYALMVNLTIYVSYIKQFWATASIKKTILVVWNVCLMKKELARMGYEKPPPNCSMASAVICLATCRKFNFSKYIFDSMVRNVDSPSKFLMYPRFLQVLINNQVDDLSSHTTRYTSYVLTQKVFANMRRIGKGFLGVETPLFATMLVQPHAAVEEEDKEDEVPAAPTPPSPTHKPLPPTHVPITTPPQAQPDPPSSPLQEQPTTTSASDMTILNTLMETCTTLSHKGRIERKDDDNTADKEVNVVEPIVFNDEEVTMTMAQTLIKMKAKKARLLDEQMAKRLHDEEVEQAAAREKQEKDDLEKDKVLQKQKYQILKRKPISIAQARKNMIVYLKNMAGYKMEQFKGMTYDRVRPIFEREYNKVQTLFKPNKYIAERTKKRVAEETLLHESFKKLKAVEVSGSHSTQDTPTHDPKEMSKEDVKNMLKIVPVSEFKLQVDEDYEMAKDLVMKIFMKANKPKSKRKRPLILTPEFGPEVTPGARLTRVVPLCVGATPHQWLEISSAPEGHRTSRPFGGKLEKVWMKTRNLLLSSLPRGPVRPPGNGCTSTVNGGNPCIGSMKLACRIGGVAAPT
nr:uncharacterized mitochondrial protein AtMg00810-like [Tanacetum cinerariifolium]